MSSAAERELRAIARGQEPSVQLLHDPPSRPYLPLRAAGSLGAIDLLLARDRYVFVLEVKDTGYTTGEGGATVDLTKSSGKELEQRDTFLDATHGLDRSVFRSGYAVRRKGRLPEGVPRWTFHPRASLHEVTQLRANDGYALLPLLDGPSGRGIEPLEVPA